MFFYYEYVLVLLPSGEEETRRLTLRHSPQMTRPQHSSRRSWGRNFSVFSE